MGEGIKLPVINGLGRTDRIDKWWTQPLAMGIALTAALIYTAWRLVIFPDSISYELEGSKVMSPIFSPNILEWDLFGLNEWDHPGWVNAAILVLWIPFGFRGTCYYMRRVYYRTFFASPTACWVDDLTSTRKLDMEEKSACSSSIIYTDISSMLQSLSLPSNGGMLRTHSILTKDGGSLLAHSSWLLKHFC